MMSTGKTESGQEIGKWPWDKTVDGHVVEGSLLMRAPIFVDDDGDLCAFETAEDARRYIEPIDVKSGVYAAYDSTGRALALEVEPSRVAPRRETVLISELPPQPGQDVELKRLLAARLHRIGVDPAGLTLDELVSVALARFRTR